MLLISKIQKSRRFSEEDLLNKKEVHMQETQDMVLQRYLSDNERYADLINGFRFQGQQVLKGSDFSELDTQTGSRG